MKLIDRWEVVTHRGSVRILVGGDRELESTQVLVVGPEHARLLAAEIEDAAGVAALEEEETKATMAEDSPNEGGDK